MDVAAAEALVVRLVGGEVAAWPALATMIHPLLERLARNRRHLGPLAEAVDHRREVVVATLAKLGRNQWRSLHTFGPWREANPTKDFGDWLRIVVANVAREHVERTLGGRGASAAANQRLVHTLATALGEDDGPGLRPAMTDAQTAREILEYARAHLDPRQTTALAAWLEGADADAIAVAVGVADPDLAARMVRAALARLRRAFT